MSMSAAISVNQIAESAPRVQARLAGLVAWITTTAGFSAIVVGNLVVSNDAAATAHNILTHETVFRLAVVGDVVSALYIAYTLLLYRLLRPVNRELAALGALFSLVGVAVGMLIPLFEVAPLVVLKDAQSLSGYSQAQVQATALVYLQLRTLAYTLSMVLFGTYNVLTGYLIFRSTFLPHILGVLLAIAGLGYLINSFATFLAPDVEAHLLPWILLPGGAELLLAFWLLVFGVNAQRWHEQARAAEVSPHSGGNR
jgi:hypothetical protein